MQLNVVFFARLKRETGLDQLRVEAPDGCDVRTLATLVERQTGVTLRGCMVAVNETYAQPDTPLAAGDEVAFLPPVAGGSEADDATHCALSDQPLYLDAADSFLVRPQYGAQAYFVGTVRSPNAGKVVHWIDYEAYAPLALRVMAQAAQTARERFGELRVYIQHRTGRLQPGEASILIGVASAHRRAALEACDFIIEHLKVQVPVWKRECDDSGEHWVAGQTGHDTL
ncbi:molybdopterin converting factor subunit 1 [Deinococcus multiflagellatus]|uniref:Molybdopterin converting factor subunit 1 n=1 Tax=Deinococcus multiflagellatus TaxID=1656887 RepID=A0ABW1ZLQ1_9DEIO|nr:molybdopterin converting factor subunit 1 [Deinococcus multiflagellatus]MBZ9713979.1 molybdopterin converting factor subunit 1 [Deinococcus multiflagellatus]